MSIVLGVLIDWLERTSKAHPVLKGCLIGAVFGMGCWIAYMEWVVAFR